MEVEEVDNNQSWGEAAGVRAGPQASVTIPSQTFPLREGNRVNVTGKGAMQTYEDYVK